MNMLPRSSTAVATWALSPRLRHNFRPKHRADFNPRRVNGAYRLGDPFVDETIHSHADAWEPHAQVAEALRQCRRQR